MDNKTRVIFLDAQAPEMMAYWKSLAADYSLDYEAPAPGADHDLAALLDGAEAVIVQRKPLSAEMILKAPRLKMIQKYGCRRDRIDLTTARARGIAVALMSLPGTVAVAEHVFTLMLACAKKLIPAHQMTSTGAYRQLGLEPKVTTERVHAFQWMKIQGLDELFRQKLGIIGFGEIGTEVARRARAFGMQVLYSDPYRLDAAIEAEEGVTYCSMEDLLRQADYITLHPPLTPETERLMGARALELMKPTAFLINCSRGGVVNEQDLTAALRENRIAGAGLDVFIEEPVPFDNPLLGMDNVVLTPHIAGGKGGARERQPRSVFANIRRFLDGQPVEYRLL